MQHIFSTMPGESGISSLTSRYELLFRALVARVYTFDLGLRNTFFLARVWAISYFEHLDQPHFLFLESPARVSKFLICRFLGSKDAADNTVRGSHINSGFLETMPIALSIVDFPPSGSY